MTSISDIGLRNFLYQLNGIKERMDAANLQITSGKRINKPSDDPSSYSTILNLKNVVSQGEQYIRNIDRSLTFLQINDSTFQQVENLIMESKDLTMEAADDTVSADARKAIAEKIDSIREEMISLANTKFLNRYIFSGTQTLTEPFKDTGGSVVYSGNSENINIQVERNVNVTINVPGNQAFQSDEDIFQVLKDLSDALISNDSEVISDSKQKLETCLNQILRYRTISGKRINLIENTKERLSDFTLIATEQVSKEEDADVAEAITNFLKEQVGLNAAISAGASILTPSLFDYLG
ncbi:MAG: flagellar hook-associated protein 3 [Candidatus Schekmanbacteria bacterium RBG_13_48_7]|uniref:Flagellar hook-associated protein 3 n=1 Tax=Candidatus Schekmanbacteria bacterium RBG_13_48_7 TaxID=1817878 RepID=A0A1F7RK79_9BACT|nr:MAG: flagellar hook-associated protein 3 [Candidatus Schekmanbacteria bacterium RBG_13_48_7]